MTNTAFIEAYFSNYIEGTRFLVEEARAIAFEGVIPQQRPKDGRDILGTFQILGGAAGPRAATPPPKPPT